MKKILLLVLMIAVGIAWMPLGVQASPQIDAIEWVPALETSDLTIAVEAKSLVPIDNHDYDSTTPAGATQAGGEPLSAPIAPWRDKADEDPLRVACYLWDKEGCVPRYSSG